MIKYYIRTTGERQLDSSYSQIEYELLVDKEHRYIDFFVDELERVGSDDCVIIEDDCVLCKDFKKRIEEVIGKFPNEIINFFQFPAMAYFKTHSSTNYLMNQCTYYPKGLSKTLARKMRELHKDFPELATDELENKALKELGVSHIKYRPCLVQHLNFSSLLGHKLEIHRTIFFIDYLDKLHLDYNNLSNRDIKRLTIEMKYDIERRKHELVKKGELE